MNNRESSYVSPIDVLRDHFAKIIIDPEGFLTKREFDKDREGFVVAMILVGIHKITSIPWFMKMIEQKYEPPDALTAMYRINEEQRLEELSIPVEVMFVPKYVRNQKWDNSLIQEENFYNLICNKKFDTKSYDPATNLFVYVDLDLRDFKLSAFADLIKNRKPNYGGIWMLASISADGNEYLVRQLYPEQDETLLYRQDLTKM